MKTYNGTAKLAANKFRGQRAFVVSALLAAEKPESLEEIVARISPTAYADTFKGGLEGWAVKFNGGVPRSVQYHLTKLKGLEMVEEHKYPAVTRTQIVGWGNSQAVRIPKAILNEARIREGDVVEIRCDNGRIALVPVNPRLTLESLVAGITPENRHGELDWGKPVGREVW